MAWHSLQPFLDELQPTPGRQHTAILAQWSRLRWPVHDLHNLLCPKMIRVTCCVGRDIVLDTHKVWFKNAHHQWKHTIAEKMDVALAGEGSTQYHQFTPTIMVDGTPYHDLGTTVSIRVLDAHINQSLPLPATHTGTTIIVKQREVRIIAEDTAPETVPDVPSSVHSPTHMAASPVIQSQSGTSGGKPRPIASNQKPVYNAPNWQPPSSSADHLHAQTGSRDEAIVPDHSDQLSVFSGCGQAVTPLTSTLSADVADQCLHSIAKLLTHLCNKSNILATSGWE